MEPVYQVSFFKKIIGGAGHEVDACQGMVEVHACDAERAIEIARPLFAELVRVADWSLRADSATAELLPHRRHAAAAWSGAWSRERRAR